jgi:hypothetical protein
MGQCNICDNNYFLKIESSDCSERILVRITRILTEGPGGIFLPANSRCEFVTLIPGIPEFLLKFLSVEFGKNIEDTFKTFLKQI